MNLEQLQILLQRTKNAADNPCIVELCNAFEMFMDLYASRNQVHSDPVKFEEKLKGSYHIAWKSFHQAAASYGLNGTLVQQYLMNPDHFSIEGKAEMQRFQQTFEAFEKPILKPVKEKKHKNKNNKKVRI